MAAKPPLLFWKVLKAPTNGAKIAGKKGRKLNDVSQAANAMMHMQALEGVVGECDANGVLKFVPTPATPTAPPAGGSGSGGGSSANATATGH